MFHALCAEVAAPLGGLALVTASQARPGLQPDHAPPHLQHAVVAREPRGQLITEGVFGGNQVGAGDLRGVSNRGEGHRPAPDGGP